MRAASVQSKVRIFLFIFLANLHDFKKMVTCRKWFIEEICIFLTEIIVLVSIVLWIEAKLAINVFGHNREKTLCRIMFQFSRIM